MSPKISVKQAFRTEFEKLFQNTDSSLKALIEESFHCIDEILTDSLLFIGLNPSNTDEIKDNFYNLRQVGNEYQKYWNAFEKISQELAMPWSHLDLLVIRCTSQKEIMKLFNSNVGRQFIFAQVMISKQILLMAKPKIIVVTNSVSRELLGKNQKDGNAVWMGYNFYFDEVIGTDRIISDDILNDTPVFFTSMLSGQRALDIGSRDRLIWHIRQVLKYLAQKCF